MVYRILVLTDIHANSIALDAVLKDINTQRDIQEYWFLGDYVAFGPDPIGVLERITRLPNAHFIRGNTDRYIVNVERPGPSIDRIIGDPKALAQQMHIESSLSWTTGALHASGWFPWLKALPLDFRKALPGDVSVLAVHAAPGTDDGSGIHTMTTEEKLRGLVINEDAQIILVGHTHSHFDRTINGVRVVNPGSVSNPYPPDLRANYVTLTIEDNSVHLQHHKVSYDHEAVITAMQQANHPSTEYVTSYMRGEIIPPW